MSSDKQGDEDSETVASSTEKTDDQEEPKSKSTESDDDDTDSNASSEYEVEKIVSKRRRRRGGFEYFIKWVGYDDSANEWIPESSLNCPERLAEFQRTEEHKRKRSRRGKERFSSQRRRSKNRSKKRRVKVIDDDDDDDNDNDEKEKEEEEEEQEPSKSVELSNSSSINSVKPKTTNSISYGVQKGYEVQAILGINRTKGDELHYLVHYKSPTTFEDNMELIPSNIAKTYCEDEIIQFYETRISWNDQQNNG